jgi:addiction module HigA family antidote
MSEAKVPILPREALKEMLLQDRGLTQGQLADQLGISRPRLSMVLSGRCPVSAELALRIERVFGIPAQFWMGLGVESQLFQERQRLREHLAALPRLRDGLDVRSPEPRLAAIA